MAKQRGKRGCIVMVPAWVAKDGRVIPVQTMETDHLEATVALIRRRGFISKHEAAPFPDPPVGFHGDGACDAAELSFDMEVSAYMKQKVSKSLHVLEAELNKRKRSSK